MDAITTGLPWRIGCWVGADPSAGEAPKNKYTNKTPAVWRGNDLRIEIALLDPSGVSVITDVSFIASVLVMVSASQTDSTKQIDRVISADGINQGLTQQEWDANTNQHLVCEFNNEETKLNLGGQASKDFWLTVAITTTHTPAKKFTVYAGLCKWVEDGTPANEGNVVGGNYIPDNATYDVGGAYSLSGLTAGRTYLWTKGSNDTNLVNGGDTLTVNGIFNSLDGTAVLHGTPGTAVTCTVRSGVYPTIDEADTRYLPRNSPNAHWRYRDGGWQVEDAMDGKWLPVGAYNRQWSLGDPVD